MGMMQGRSKEVMEALEECTNMNMCYVQESRWTHKFARWMNGMGTGKSLGEVELES